MSLKLDGCYGFLPGAACVEYLTENHKIFTPSRYHGNRALTKEESGINLQVFLTL